MPNLVWLRTFEAAARLLNFTETGRQLGLTQTAVSQHIKGLETALGCQLFVRKPRNLELTDMGHAYVHTVRRSLADIGFATNSLFGRSAKQTITVRAPVSTATLWLAQHLPVFLAAHPSVNIKLVSTIWASAISDDDVDIDLRIGHGDWPGVQVEKISTETIVAICASGKSPSINEPADLLKLPLIQIIGHEENWSELLANHNFEVSDASVRYQVDTTATALALVSSGGGIASIMTRFATAAIKAGQRIEIIGEPFAFSQSHYLTTRPNDGELNPEIDLVKDWLRSLFQALR